LEDAIQTIIQAIMKEKEEKEQKEEEL